MTSHIFQASDAMLAVSDPPHPTAGSIAAPAGARRVAIDPLALATTVAVAVGLALRWTTGRDLPLWLDETFTGAIAAEPSLAAVGHQILADVNAPLYYLIAHAWSLVFGLSNASLRFPAFLFSAAAPLLCLVPTPAIGRRVRLVWCMLAALWGPGLAYAQEARCYSLVFCLGVALTTAFAALLQAPSRRRAVAWAAIGTLAVLAHYHALVLLAFQGIAFLAIHRRRAMAAWPAALVLVPLAAWLVVASDRIRAFNAAGIAWYGRMGADELLDVLRFTTGLDLAAALGLVVLALVALVAWARARRAPPDGARVDTAVVAAAAALASLSLVVALAFVRPSFTMRYLMAFEPGLLLGLALAAERLRRVVRIAPPILVALMAEGAFATPVAAPPKAINFEAASDALIADGTRTLAFFWDNPDNAVEAPSQLAAVGGFFFRRNGVKVEMRPLLGSRGDPNPRLLALAQGPHAGILWVYDKHIHDTAAKAFPPRIAEAPGWSCRDFGGGAIGILACHRRAA